MVFGLVVYKARVKSAFRYCAATWEVMRRYAANISHDVFCYVGVLRFLGFAVFHHLIVNLRIFFKKTKNRRQSNCRSHASFSRPQSNWRLVVTHIEVSTEFNYVTILSLCKIGVADISCIFTRKLKTVVYQSTKHKREQIVAVTLDAAGPNHGVSNWHAWTCYDSDYTDTEYLASNVFWRRIFEISGPWSDNLTYSAAATWRR